MLLEEVVGCSPSPKEANRGENPKVLFDLSGNKGSLIVPVDVEALCKSYDINCNGRRVKGYGQRYDTPIGKPEYQMIQDCINWLVLNTTPSKRQNTNIGSSYHLKHVVERACGRYVCNGTMIVAAIICGYRCGPWSGPNCYFNIKVNKGVINRGY